MPWDHFLFSLLEPYNQPVLPGAVPFVTSCWTASQCRAFQGLPTKSITREKVVMYPSQRHVEPASERGTISQYHGSAWCHVLTRAKGVAMGSELEVAGQVTLKIKFEWGLGVGQGCRIQHRGRICTSQSNPVSGMAPRDVGWLKHLMEKCQDCCGGQQRQEKWSHWGGHVGVDKLCKTCCPRHLGLSVYLPVFWNNAVTFPACSPVLTPQLAEAEIEQLASVFRVPAPSPHGRSEQTHTILSE